MLDGVEHDTLEREVGRRGDSCLRGFLAFLLAVFVLCTIDPTPRFCGLPRAPGLIHTPSEAVATVLPSFEVPASTAPRPGIDASFVAEPALELLVASLVPASRALPRSVAPSFVASSLDLPLRC